MKEYRPVHAAFAFAATATLSCLPSSFLPLPLFRGAERVRAREGGRAALERPRDLKPPPPLLELLQSCPAMAGLPFLALFRTFLVSPCSFLPFPSLAEADTARTTDDP